MNRVELGDSIQLIKTLDTESVHLILSDIPYGINYDEWDVLHSNTNSALLGASPAQLKSSIFKSRGKPLNGWSEADKKISKEEVEQIIGRMKFNETNPVLVEYMTNHYQKDVSITYLDNVIEKFCNGLEEYATTGKEITDKFFTNFINIHLK